MLTMAATVIAQPCWLLTLPDELKLHIVNYLDTRRDIYNLSRTCRTLEDAAMARLYYDVDLSLSEVKALRTPILRTPVTHSVRHITLRNERTRKRDTETVSQHDQVDRLLDIIPAGRLISFMLLHQTALTAQTLNLLTHRHGTSLQSLGFCELAPSLEPTIVPSNLTGLECRTVNDGEGVEKIISASTNTLQRLHLGQEKPLLMAYHSSRVGSLERIPQPKETFFSAAFAMENMPRLRDLSLSGIDLMHLRPSSIPRILFFCGLERLSLESCPGTTEFLDEIATAFTWVTYSADAPQTPRTLPSLRHFLLRHESPTAALKAALVHFSTSFTGLRTLSVLFENGTIFERPSTLIAGHGPTLRTLVLEARIQPREHLGLDTSRPFGAGGYSSDLWADTIDDIARLCPNIEQLGMGFPWSDEMVRLRKTSLPALARLKTMHVRNFPENRVCSQVGDYSIKEYANRFIEWAFPQTSVGSNKPSLEHLAIGPTVHESRWKMAPGAFAAGPRSSQPPEFLRTHHFCLDWAQTRFGHWSPLTTPVSEKFMEEIIGQKPLKGVFEQVWLK
ncbi:uncharacterized protein PV06_04887 [Exophiala oligosperma]|uniref:F-box domain-containing protein n=1 Tax=Exophiala oligosperma TaxID=215243 RepID=A0A0D2E7N9_9EURO|nr:uncharacterized protein PV06_04887 [Exophiala oligosperma]KIW43824.1 hypothetical protein PV06_04887 [Exophiala oligosperma]